ncbi:PP0621 family protein [Helicobacter sp. MIT 99-5507]|uniref:PP0621 family protein n=1 Tax=Helicobacter sp. MIT 99-5507 TaxID=152489 RepID=UPI000E1F229B|nr:PP0621 family protein [Helicobacter sp. MIT 99-5507]RDU57499.1 hypothetical protein CQA42_06150 [Helicobacter sp. MIT 99-5507]
MGRFIIFGLIIVAIWFLFFRKKKNKDNKDNHTESFDMIECARCKSFVSKDDAIFANGRWYCGKECLINKD